MSRTAIICKRHNYENITANLWLNSNDFHNGVIFTISPFLHSVFTFLLTTNAIIYLVFAKGHKLLSTSFNNKHPVDGISLKLKRMKFLLYSVSY